MLAGPKPYINSTHAQFTEIPILRIAFFMSFGYSFEERILVDVLRVGVYQRSHTTELTTTR